MQYRHHAKSVRSPADAPTSLGESSVGEGPLPSQRMTERIAVGERAVEADGTIRGWPFGTTWVQIGTGEGFSGGAHVP